MPEMKVVRTGAPGAIAAAAAERPVPGPRDVLVRVRACGICGTSRHPRGQPWTPRPAADPGSRVNGGD